MTYGYYYYLSLCQNEWILCIILKNKHVHFCQFTISIQTEKWNDNSSGSGSISSCKSIPTSFAISSYFTILKSNFINYIISFYNTSNIPKLYFFFPILFKYSFLFLFLTIFFSLPFLLFLPQPLAPATTKQTITTMPPLPSAQQNPTRTKNQKIKIKNKIKPTKYPLKT